MGMGVSAGVLGIAVEDFILRPRRRQTAELAVPLTEQQKLELAELGSYCANVCARAFMDIALPPTIRRNRVRLPRSRVEPLPEAGRECRSLRDSMI